MCYSNKNKKHREGRSNHGLQWNQWKNKASCRVIMSVSQVCYAMFFFAISCKKDATDTETHMR